MGLCSATLPGLMAALYFMVWLGLVSRPLTAPGLWVPGLRLKVTHSLGPGWIMEHRTLRTALEAEHRDIDGGIETFLEQASEELGSTEELRRSLAGLRRHIYLEEEFLFPPLKSAGLMGPIFVMEREHGALWKAMDEVDGLIAENDGTAVHKACTHMLEVLAKHNAMEEKVIYAQADELLDQSAGRKLLEFMESGSAPAGWVAHSAR